MCFFYYFHPQRATTNGMKKNCKECGESFSGRADAKFCSDHCRSNFHNRKYGTKVPYVRRINATLRKNRKILEGFNPEGKSRVHRKDLAKKGFDFNYFTNIYTTKAGKQYFFCYEYGYLHTGADWFTLVVKQEYV